MNHQELIEAAWEKYNDKPWLERRKRFYALMIRIEDYENLPSEWREAVKEEMNRVYSKKETQIKRKGLNNDKLW